MLPGENQSPKRGGWLIVESMFRFAVSLAPAAAGALTAALACTNLACTNLACTEPGGKRG
jgi:hypothetical protein